MSTIKLSHAAIVNAQAILRGDKHLPGFGPLEDDASRPLRRVVIGKSDFGNTGVEVAAAILHLLEKAGGQRGSTIRDGRGIISDMYAIEADVTVLQKAREIAQGQPKATGLA